jgi:D-3-phosphoglycerate dehydrogenase
MTLRVLVSDPLSERGLERLRSAPGFEVDHRPGLSEAELKAVIPPYHALVVRSGSKVTGAVLEAAKNLKVVGRAGIGVDNVNVGAASRLGIVVMNSPRGNAVTTAEHAISLLLALARHVPQAFESVRAGKWERSRFQGREIDGKTLGLVGLGNVGRWVAEKARGLGMKVLAYDPVVTADRAAQLGVTLAPTLDELLAGSDFVTLHVPLTDATRNLLDARALARMKPGALLVNASRGGIVDESALYDALLAGKLGGAALDVFVEEPPKGSPLLGLPNVIATPHLGASTEEAQERVAVEIADQVVAYLVHGIVQNAVNVPAVSPEKAPKLQPYLVLARALGSLLAQFDLSGLREVEVDSAGLAAELGATAITSEAVAAILAHFLDFPVNSVNAALVAAERGVRVVEGKAASAAGYEGLVTVVVRGRTSDHTAAGTCLGGGPRLTNLDGHDLDVRPEGTLLILANEDRPGVIGAVGTILGKANVNISRMQVGLRHGSADALGVFNVDSPVPEDALEEIRRIPETRFALQVRL